jgi:hypothetical protein
LGIKPPFSEEVQICPKGETTERKMKILANGHHHPPNIPVNKLKDYLRHQDGVFQLKPQAIWNMDNKSLLCPV